jgi:sulfate adenylyltransferase subunit 1 (EFTu-like GTPase family)
MINEFLVHSVTKTKSLVVNGIVNSGTILVGNQFKLVKPPSGSWPVELIVKEIVSYGRQLNELPKGMSGRLCLSGELTEVLSKGDLLIGNMPEDEI